MPHEQEEVRPAKGQADHEPAAHQGASSLEVYGGADVVPSAEAAARRLTSRIRLLLDSIAGQVDKLVPLVTEAQASKAHEALGYRSWTEYVAAEFKDNPLRLDRDDRRELVSMLSGEGMSTRAIATVVGASPATVKRDLTSGGSHEPPDKPITGVDGKVYPPAAQPSVTGVAYEGSTASRLFFERLGKLEYLHEELALRAQKLGPDSEEDAETRSYACDHLIWPRLGRCSSRILAPPGW